MMVRRGQVGLIEEMIVEDVVAMIGEVVVDEAGMTVEAAVARVVEIVAVAARVEEDNFHINVYRAAPVVVLDGTQKMYGLSAALTPRSIAEQAGAHRGNRLRHRVAARAIKTGGLHERGRSRSFARMQPRRQ